MFKKSSYSIVNNTKTASIPPPTKGWNTRDPIAQMDSAYAVLMENVFPATEDVVIRNGYAAHKTGITTPIRTLMDYAGRTTSKMFAVSAGKIYDVTTQGTYSAPVVSGLSNSDFQFVNFGNSGGSFLLCCNGQDGLRSYDGTTWATQTITGMTNPVWIQAHNRRIFMGEQNSLKFGYLATEAIAGAVSLFDLSPEAGLGGYLVGMCSWTRDGGSGMDDLAVFITSNGEAIIYQGIDPSNINDWSKIGTFRIGKPVGRRFFARTGGDVTLITQDGYLPLSGVLPIDRIGANKVAISNQINSVVTKALKDYGGNFGWQVIVYPKSQWLLFNIPITSTLSEQHVFNLQTKSPCRFTNMNALCWGLFNDQLYFGDYSGNIFKADSGNSDNGANIDFQLKPAFNYFGYRGRQKHFKLVRPFFEATDSFSVAVTMETDFQESQHISYPSFTPSSTSKWDQSYWDVDFWGGYFTSYKWISVTNIGYAATVHIIGSSKTLNLSLKSIDYQYSVGGVI